MLVEFRVKNFRSIRDEQVFSLVASSDKKLRDTHVQGTKIKAIPGILRSAVVYGANASGKSNLIKAIQYMRNIVLKSSMIRPPDVQFSIEPFMLDQKTKESPSEFEMTFLIDDTRYQYGFSMNRKRILSEYLLVFKKFKPQHWFERTYDKANDKDVYAFKTGLTGSKQMWEEATRSDSLFLSMAAQLNSKALKPIFDWFAEGLVVLSEHEKLAPDYSVKVITEEDGASHIRNFLEAADITISKIDVRMRKVSGQTINIDAATGKLEIQSGEIDSPEIRFHHDTENESAVFDFNDESSGTRNLFTLAGPVLDILQKGKTLIIDELDTSLHPLIVKEFVKLFHRPEGGAQLIFSTHDTSLLDSYGLFRRDQIWFTEKTQNQATTLVTLSDFSPRNNEALERGYLSGRYGGIPFLDNNKRLKL